MKDLFKLLNPTDTRSNEEILEEFKTQRLYTIKFNRREYQTTDSRTALKFSFYFGHNSVSWAPYQGEEIPDIRSVH